MAITHFSVLAHLRPKDVLPLARSWQKLTWRTPGENAAGLGRRSRTVTAMIVAPVPDGSAVIRAVTDASADAASRNVTRETIEPRRGCRVQHK